MLVLNDLNRFNVAELFATELDETELKKTAELYEVGSVLKYYDSSSSKLVVYMLVVGETAKEWAVI